MLAEKGLSDDNLVADFQEFRQQSDETNLASQCMYKIKCEENKKF
jgi:hypothetical protein